MTSGLCEHKTLIAVFFLLYKIRYLYVENSYMVASLAMKYRTWINEIPSFSEGN